MGYWNRGGGGGVTLLEIMLVLAIAAVIIVMSVRYYQSASASQRANACLSYLQAVAAAADSFSEATQSYSGITSSEIDAIVPRNEAVCNWAGNDTVGQASDTLIGFNIRLPEQACQFMIHALNASKRWGDGYAYVHYDYYLSEDNCSGRFNDYPHGGLIYYHRNISSYHP